MMPTRFSWLWYLVGLAGMALMIFGVISLLGSAAGAGLLVPVVVVAAVAIWFVVRRFRRSLDDAVANAPSRQGSAGSSAPEAGPSAVVPAAGGPVDAGDPGDADGSDDADATTDVAATASGRPAAPPRPPTQPGPVTTKPPSGPPRTSRR